MVVGVCCDVAGVAEINEYFWISLIYFFDVFSVLQKKILKLLFDF